MTRGDPARATTPRRRIGGIRLAGVLVVATAIAAALGHQMQASSTSASSSAGAAAPVVEAPPVRHRDARGEHRGARGESDGAVPDGTTVFDDGVPGVANLDPALLGALRRAAADAARDGVQLLVESGWRSAAYQERLLQEAIAAHGSREEAARWVATPDTSAHVSGDAVDVGPAAAAAWLSARGAGYGLCRVYANEPWHYELRAEAIDGGCPPLYADPSRDPRLRP